MLIGGHNSIQRSLARRAMQMTTNKVAQWTIMGAGHLLCTRHGFSALDTPVEALKVPAVKTGSDHRPGGP